MRLISAAFALILCPLLSAAPIVLTNDRWSVQFDPATLQADAVVGGTSLSISSPGETIEPRDVQQSPATLGFRRGGFAVHVELKDNALRLGVTADAASKFAWPILRATPPARAVVLPTYEGAYVPMDDAEWREFLIKQGPIDTTAGLIMPFWGVQFADSSLVYILDTPFNNELKFSGEANVLGMELTHEFTPNQTQKSFGVIVQLTDSSPVAAAKTYRKYLVDAGRFITMREKIAKTPKAERLLGAAHVYVWGDALQGRQDVKDWKKFAGELESSPIGAKLSDESKKLVHEIATKQYPGDYATNAVAAELSKLDAATLTGAFPDAFIDPKTWGDGVSTKMLDKLHDAGLDRLCITTGGLDSAMQKPQVAARADELGYLFGPYDSYHSIHRPGETDTWETAQFNQALFDNGPIVDANGKKLGGFKKKGFKLSPIAAWPYVEKRVSDHLAAVPFTSWFVDCDAFGEVFDDYSPLHPATQAQDAKARCDRLAWLSSAKNLVVGSEGGTAFAAPAIHFAHGMMTPVIGWGDPDLTNRDSKYFLGRYWPPDGPAVFLKSVPLKPYYQKFFFDPRYRLPLYQTVFHDSVISTHHWSAASLKFADQAQTVELLEQLYNVPPIYHLNLAEFKKLRDRITAHYAFFSPLHRDLAEQAMTSFEFLSDDRLVQRTTFANGLQIIANFSETEFTGIGPPVPPRTVLARRARADGPTAGELRRYTPPR